MIPNLDSEEYEGMLLADGFEKAFLGVARPWLEHLPTAVYSREKCVEILQEDMGEEEAEEYFQFNVEGAYVGPQTPIFVVTELGERP